MKLENCIFFFFVVLSLRGNQVARCIEHVVSFETWMEEGPKDHFVSNLYFRMMLNFWLFNDLFLVSKKKIKNGEVIQSLDSGIVPISFLVIKVLKIKYPIIAN